MIARRDKDAFLATFDDLSFSSQRAIMRLVRTLATCEALVVPTLEIVASSKPRSSIPGDPAAANVCNEIDATIKEARETLNSAHRRAIYLINHAARVGERLEMRRGSPPPDLDDDDRRGPYRRKR